MKQLIHPILFLILLTSCGGSGMLIEESAESPVRVTMDLVAVDNDKINITVNPGKLEGTAVYQMPKTVPGTYSTDNYGRLIENVKAFSYNGEELAVNKLNDNSFSIADGSSLDYITYKANDSFDIEGELGIFSPAGTNIAANENFVLNLHGFLGYFNNQTEIPYQVEVSRPNNMMPSTALRVTTSEVGETATVDNFMATRYFEITDNPIQYNTEAAEVFTVDNMEVILDVYSPNGAYSAADLLPNIQTMVRAQKDYLGDINDTPLYAILLYLSEMNGTDAGGFGALEHHTSTIVVLPEQMQLERLNETMTDVVAHEFFHTLTPLNVHSEEIHYFDYADPDMSKHLWMYEGVTEYFANHFQIHENLISEEDFFERMQGKINNSMRYNDELPFTEMSENILEEEYEDEYINVYEKGALIAMALDIRLRELSNGETGILHLMGELSKRYGTDKPFEDDALISEIVSITYPEIQSFFDTYVTGSTPIPYEDFFAKVGLGYVSTEAEVGLFLQDMQTPYIDADTENKTIYFPEGIALNSMLTKLGVKGGDELVSLNGTDYNLDNIQAFFMSSMTLQPGADITMVVNRNGSEVELSGTYEQPTAELESLQTLDLPETDERVSLRNAWLYN